MGAYEKFAQVYDLFMDNIDYEEWADYITGHLREYGIEDGLVLELGCGTGTMTGLLADKGYDMIGVDNSEEMLAEAMEKRVESGQDILYLLQDMQEFELYGTVRAVVSVCDSLNYITDRDELRHVFELVNNYLDPEGIFLFDMNTVHKYRDILGDTTIAENRDEGSFIWDNSYDEEEGLNYYELAVFLPREDGLYEKAEEVHCQKAYPREEIEELIREAGMELLAVYDAYTGKAASEESERLFFIAREKGKAIAADSQIRAFAAVTTETVETARKDHNTSPVATAALGRLLTAGSMMGVMMKGDKDILTLQVKGDGLLQGITVTADSKGRVKGYVVEPDVIIPANAKGKLDVGGAVGHGFLQVIKDMGLKEPYVGQVALQTGEIAEDLTYYFAASEQVPSAVGLGVLMNKDNTVRQAGGFIVQVMPFAEEETIAKLEANVQKIQSVTTLLEQGHTPESLLEQVLDGFDIEINDRIPTEFYCNCSKERVEKALISIGRKELNEMIQEGKKVELNCHFCNTNYTFSVEELKEILRKCK